MRILSADYCILKSTQYRVITLILLFLYKYIFLMNGRDLFLLKLILRGGGTTAMLSKTYQYFLHIQENS